MRTRKVSGDIKVVLEGEIETKQGVVGAKRREGGLTVSLAEGEGEKSGGV